MSQHIEDDFDEEALFKTPERIQQGIQQRQQHAHMTAPMTPPMPQPPAPMPAAPVDPLAKYYRTPGVHLNLPTKGAFFAPGEFHPTITGEVAVFPMTGADEMLMKDPDSLMSGYAVENLIKSCVPAIQNPRNLSMPDLDALLLAIRAASYGDVMDVAIECPNCKHENTFDCHLPSLMSTMTFIDPENEVRLGDEVIVYVRPYTLATATRIALAMFEEQRKLQAYGDDDDIAVVTAARNESFRRMTSLNTRSVADSIVSIIVPEGQVTDPQSIFKFFSNTSTQWQKQIEKKLSELNAVGVDKRMPVQCVKCDHEWQTTVEFDPATFFG